MINNKELRKAQLKMVDILDAIDVICSKHKIEYWVAYGTLLGAVRHKGFIPWDDDCDICMMRKDYDKFVEVAKKELPKNMFFQDRYTDPGYKRSISKVRMNDTKLIEFCETDHENFHQGIYVDVFVFDYYVEPFPTIIKNIEFINNFKYYRKKFPKGSLKRTLVSLGVAIPYVFLSTTKKITKALSILFKSNDKLTQIGLEVNNTDYKFFNKNLVFPLKRTEIFEGRKFYVPNNCDAVLKIQYGDYMQILPEEYRQSHAKYIEC